jgi:3-oxoadipate enol-lactonase
MATTSTIQIDTTTSLSFVTTQPSPPNSNPTLVFLHFWGGSSATFRHLLPLLSAYPTVSPTFRGWGDSTGPSNASEYGIKNLASDILSLISQMSIQSYILIGHSMGGKVAQLIASQRPPGLQKLILLAPAPPTPLVLPTEEMRQQQIHAYDTPEAAEFVIRNVLSSTTLADDDVKITVRDCMSGSDVATTAWPMYAAGEDISSEVGKINVPVLVLVGELNRVEPVERVRTEVVSRISGAKLTALHGVGHLLPLESSKEVVQEIEAFVQR